MYQPTKFGVALFKSYGGVLNFKFRSRDPDHAHFKGQFDLLWQTRVVLNMHTKYEVSSLNRSKDIEGSQNLHIY